MSLGPCTFGSRIPASFSCMTARRSFRVWPVSTACTRANQRGASGSSEDDLSSSLTVRLGARRPGLLEVDDHGVGTVKSGFLDLFALASRHEENGA